MTRWSLAATLAAAGAAACSSKSRAPGRDAAPAVTANAAADAGPALPPVATRKPLAAASTDALWALAPASIQFGAVVADGGFESLGAGFAELGAVLAGDPEGAALWAKWTGAMRETLGFDLADVRRWPSVGLDPSRGGALFGTTGRDAAMILPVRDTDSFRVVYGLVQKEIDGVTIDVSPKLGFCTAVGDRYACADTTELLAAVAARSTGALGKRAMALPARLRGTVEIVAELGAFPGAQARLAPLKRALAGVGMIAVGVRLEGGRATVEAHLAGQRTGDIGKAFAALPKARSLRPHLGGAAGVLGVHAPIVELAERADLGARSRQVSIGNTDLDALITSRLTGQIALVTRGRGLAAGAAIIGLDDVAPLRQKLSALCDLVGSLLSSPAAVDAGVCRGELSPSRARLPLLPGLPAALRRPIPVAVSAESEAAVIALGDAAAPGGPAPGFALEPAHVIAWGRALDPLATAPIIEAKLLAAAIDARLAPADRRRLALVRRLLDHVYEIGVRARLDADGIRASADIITFAADPPALYSAYKVAVDRLMAGDLAGYRTQIAALGAKGSGTLVAGQADLVARGTPAIGPGTALAAALAARSWLSETDGR